MLNKYLPIHPITGLQAVGIVGGRPVWPILGGSGDGNDDSQNGSQGGPGGGQGGQQNGGQGSQQGGQSGTQGGSNGGGQSGQGSQQGSAATISLSQEALDKIVEDRLIRDRAARDKKYADYDQVVEKANNYDKLLQDTESDAEKRVREATEQARSAVLAEMRPQLVLAEMRATAAGRIEPDRFDTLVDDLDLTKYLTSDGAVDIDKVRKKVDAWAPPPKNDGEGQQQQSSGPRRPRPDHSQGSGAGPTTDTQRGLDEARRRYGDRATGPAAASK